MSARADPATLAFLTLPPLMWASNAIVGRFSVAGAAPLVSPVLFNTLRWTVALAVLFVLAHWRMPRPAPGKPALPSAALPDASFAAARAAPLTSATASPPRPARASWLIYAALGLFSVTAYNALQYQALRTSGAINVTLIAASGPVWMLLLGRLFFDERSRGWAWAGAALSLAGVLVVLSGGQAARLLGLRLAPGDLYMLAAVLSWSLYSWLLRRHRPDAPAARFLLVQTAWGLVLGLPFLAAEWAAGQMVLRLEWRTALVVAWVALGPSLLAYWCWDRGVARAGAVLPSFFGNLTPLFAALMSAALLGEPPHGYHVAAFALVAGGIVLSQRGARRATGAPAAPRASQSPGGHRGNPLDKD